MMQIDEAWAKHARWTIAIAAGTAVATKLAEWLVERVRATVEKKDRP